MVALQILSAAVLCHVAFGYSEWKPNEPKPDVVIDHTRHQQPVLAPEGTASPQQLLGKAGGVPWEDQQDHGTAANPYGDITEHYNDLTNNQGDGSDENLVVNANLTVHESEEEATLDPNDPTLVYSTPNRVSCGVGMDVHGLVCKLVFSDYVGVEVVCTCKDACKANGMGPECSKFWAHELQNLVEEDTGCTDYTAQLSVPGYWAKCRPASIVENPLAPEVKNGPAADKAGGSIYSGGGYGQVQAKQKRARAAMMLQQHGSSDTTATASEGTGEARHEEETKLKAEELMQQQIDELRSAKAQLESEKAALAAEKDKLQAHVKDLTDANAQLIQHVDEYKQKAQAAAALVPPDAVAISHEDQAAAQNAMQ